MPDVPAVRPRVPPTFHVVRGRRVAGRRPAVIHRGSQAGPSGHLDLVADVLVEVAATRQHQTSIAAAGLIAPVASCSVLSSAASPCVPVVAVRAAPDCPCLALVSM